MDKDRWAKVESIYHAALEHKPEERAAFVSNECAGDRELESEVESLLQFDGQADAFMQTSALNVAAKTLAASQVTSEQEPKIEDIGPYHFLKLIGEGGTGNVYLAVDTRLDRKVAIKILSVDFTEDVDRVSRFKQEARATSSLNHPNIVTIFEVGETQDHNYIVTEFVEGAILRARLAAALPRGLEATEAVSIITQVLQALDAAHRAGIIHRDIKPENIIVRADGLVKVLDFGIAKLDASQPASVDHLTTRTGVVIGTAAYMSPEQARGQKVDHRTDIFSVGIVLYEMLCGRKPFEGDTWSDVMAAVLVKDPPPIDSAVAAPALKGIVERCLEKEPDKRFQSASDLKFALSQALLTDQKESGPATVSHNPATSWHKTGLVIAIIIIAVLVAGIVWSKTITRTGEQPRKSVRPPNVSQSGTRLTWIDRSGTEQGTVGETGEYSGPAFSPDEQQIVVALNDPEVRTRDLWVLSRANGERRRLTSDPADEMNPLWSPDGNWIFFTANKNGVRNIYRVPASGDGPTESVLASDEDLNLEDISRDGHVLVFNFRNEQNDQPSIGLLSLPAKKRVIFASSPARSARLSPNQKWMAYTSNQRGSMIVVREVGAEGTPVGDEHVVSRSSGSATTAMWSADGKELFYLEGGTLMSVQIGTVGDRFAAGPPQSLCKVNVEDQERRNRYLVSKDGLFLMILKNNAN
ncbi:MAG TPA: protein kinase [Pyrinomonadaceae bacterium]|nr:protein kinase [Pyrinomonadaceae bacterium]